MKTLNKKNLKKINSLLNSIAVNSRIADEDYLNGIGWEEASKNKEELKKYHFGKWMLAKKYLLQIELFNEFGIGGKDVEDDAKNIDEYIADEVRTFEEYDLILEEEV
tara:strand:- start:59 stop:379 length:321 start_codon:yes stop_codon:yes gene_type:complete